jgi:DNA polymerase III epsilon subunit family exonuclease
VAPKLGLNGALFTVVDVETTGLKSEDGDRVCEIGAIKFSLAGERGRFSTLVNPRREIPPGAQKVHGITDAMVQGAPGFEQIAAPFERFIEGTVLVAQNAGFDLGFLRAEYRRFGRDLRIDHAVDTIALVKSYRALGQYNLDALAEHYGIARGTRHRSVEDCAITMQVFQRAVGELAAAGRLAGLGDVLRLGRPA